MSPRKLLSISLLLAIALHGAALLALRNARIHVQFQHHTHRIGFLGEIEESSAHEEHLATLFCQLEEQRKALPQVEESHATYQAEGEVAPIQELQWQEVAELPPPPKVDQVATPTLPIPQVTPLFALDEIDQQLSGFASEPEEAAEIATSDDFEINVTCCPRPCGEGYLFRIALSPNEAVSFKRIRQNISFLIDRSNSINRKRFNATKEAVALALQQIHTEDRFNILLFDSKVKRLAERPLPATPQNIDLALNFLASARPGGFFSSTELYKSLDKIVPDVASEQEINTAILLSDGETALDRESQRNAIARWTQLNSGKISLFCIATGKRNNLPLLDVLSAFNRGSLFYTADPNQLDTLLLSMMHLIAAPIGKEITVTSLRPPAGPKNGFSLYPVDKRAPHLYQHRPYLLYGTTPSLEEFTLFVQGRYYDRWFDIKKRVSFDSAPSCEEELGSQWALLVAHELYDQFLHTGKSRHIQSARALLEPFQLQPAFVDR